MPHALVVGCGYIGIALAEKLQEAGYQVTGLKRTPGPLPHGIQPCLADITQANTLQTLPQDLDVVFFTAAAPHFQDDSYLQTYVSGLKNLMKALKNPTMKQAPLFIFTSSTAVYAQSRGEWVDETSPTEPSHFSGKRMVQAEMLLASSGLPHAVLRLGGIYGPERARLIHDLLSGRAQMNDSDVYTNRIHRDDVVGILMHILSLKNRDTLYLGVDHEPIYNNVVIAWLAEQLSVPVPELSRASAPVRPSRSNKRCKNTRVCDSGYTFLYPSYREGFSAIIETTALDEKMG